MSNIAIVLGSNIHWAPYYYRYENFLIKNGFKDFDLILWNREGIEEHTNANLIEFNLKDKSNDKNFLKIFKFLQFSSFVKQQVKKKKYKKIIFLGLAGCALPLNVFFFKNYYKFNYWLDIRDYHYEWFKPYFALEKIAIKNAYKVAISSKGFESYLPKSDYIYIHNIDPYMDYVYKNYHATNSKAIRISFIGNVRYYNENVKLINLLANDERFLLQYIGPGSDNLITYCQKNNINNVIFKGKFPQKDTVKFYCNTDIINNIYGNNSVETLTALSNKLYYAIRLKLPIIVSSRTFMEEVSVKNGFGIAFKEEINFPDLLYKWFKSYKLQKEQINYESLWCNIKKEDENTNLQLLNFLRY